MKKLITSVAVMALLVLGGQAVALVPTIDNVPAATLLLPYFECDLGNAPTANAPASGNPNGVNTLFSVNNASATAQLAHVTVWSDQSVPVLDFDIYLTGYDVQTISICEVLVDGILPQTGSGTNTAANDPGSPLGLFSGPDVIYPNCNTTSSPPLPPVYAIPAINTQFRIHLQQLLTGRQSTVDGTCAGANYGDNIARGYITIDDVNSCSTLFPSDTGYFISGGLGIADNDNVLWGDYFYVFPGENFAQGEMLVSVEADAATLNTPGEYTFYGRYVAGTAADNREPLATTFGARYLDGGPFSGGTDFIVWRDSKFPPGVSCVTGPNYGELFEKQIVVFDEEENPVTVQQGGPSGEPTPGAQCVFCDEAQRRHVGIDFAVDEPFGWVYVNLNHTTVLDAGLGQGYIGRAQAWLFDVMSAEGRFSVGFNALAFDNANTQTNVGGLCIQAGAPFVVPCG
jgi:hypothetical protein